MAGGPIASVVPTTTACALTSITTGVPPSVHEVVGYRVRMGDDDVFNVLRWRGRDPESSVAVHPGDFQHQPIFGGTSPPVVTRAEFQTTGFTHAHLGGTRFYGWRVMSSLPVIVSELLRAGEAFVYAYYDGIDKVAHANGFGPFYDAELQAADRLVADIAAGLPAGSVLVVTADHGQVHVGDATIPLAPEVLACTRLVTGEGRFRWLHAGPGEQELLHKRAQAEYGDIAWVRTVDELEADGWFGGPLTAAGRDRLGDVALIAREPVAFADPGDPGEAGLRCRHGSVTAAEMLVPLVAVSG
jgi:predicted AlkP superfamily pyrophosphatase or phosphodiesterase